MEPFSVTWRAPEFEFHPKGVSWYWISIVIAVALIAVAVAQKNFLFGLFIVLAEIMILVWGSREPQEAVFTVSNKGFRIESHNRYYPTREIESIASFEDWSEEWGTIVVDLKAHFRLPLHIHAPRARFTEIENGFRKIVPMAHKDESLIDILERLLGF